MAEDPNTGTGKNNAGGSKGPPPPLSSASLSARAPAPKQDPNNPPAPKSAPEPEEEAHIIEEHIVKPAAPKKEPPAPQPARQTSPPPSAQPPAPPFQKPATLPQPVPRIPVPSSPPQAPASFSQQPPAAPAQPPQPPPQAPAPLKQEAVVPEQKPAPESIAFTPPTESAPLQKPDQPASAVPGALGPSKEEADRINSILKETKLPERRTEAPVKKETKTFDTQLGAQETPPQGPQAAPEKPPAPKENEKESSIVVPLRTLKNDLQTIIKEKKMSLVRAAALEQGKRHEKKETGPVPKRAPSAMRSMLISAILFTVLGAVVLAVGFFLVQDQTTQPESEITSSILFAENTFSLPLEEGTPSGTKRLVASTRGNSGTLGSITRFVPVVSTVASLEAEQQQVPITFEEFMTAIGARIPADLLRALGEDFFFGIHTIDENAPLIIVPVVSYERAFAGMLAWEETMNADLSPIFTPVPTQTLGSSGLLERRRFSDVIMRNYDVRALKDDQDTIELYYSFPTRSFLVIGENPFSFTEVLNRLRAERRI